MKSMGSFDKDRFSERLATFNDAVERELDKSGGHGVTRVFGDEGAELLEAATGHQDYGLLRSAISRRDRGAVSTIANRILDRRPA